MKLKVLDEASKNLKKANKELLEAEEKLMGKEIMPIVVGYEDNEGWLPKHGATTQREADLKRHYEIVGEIIAYIFKRIKAEQWVDDWGIKGVIYEGGLDSIEEAVKQEYLPEEDK